MCLFDKTETSIQSGAAQALAEPISACCVGAEQVALNTALSIDRQT